MFSLANTDYVDVYVIPRDSLPSSMAYLQPRGFTHFQTTQIDIKDDALELSKSKIYTFEDIPLVQKGDFLLIKLPGTTEYIYGGVIDTIDPDDNPTKPTTIQCLPIRAVFDLQFPATPINGTDVITHYWTIAKHFGGTYAPGEPYDNRVNPIECLLNQTVDFYRWGPRNIAHKYQPADAFTATNMIDYMNNITKKYNIYTGIFKVDFARDIGAGVLQPCIYLGLFQSDHMATKTPNDTSSGGDTGSTAVSMGFNPHFFGKLQIKDNLPELYDWEFTTSVGNLVANLCFVLDVSVAGIETIKTRKVNGQDVQYVASQKTSEQITATNGGRAFVLCTDGEVRQANWDDPSRGPTVQYDGDIWASLWPDLPDGPNPFAKRVELPTKSVLAIVSNKDQDYPTATLPANPTDAQKRDFYRNTLRPYFKKVAQDKLALSTYAHQFKVKLRLDSTNLDWKDFKIGKLCDVTFKGKLYKSIVTGFEFKTGTNYITIILGHNRHTLASKLQEKLI